jgi:hypothetical protein
MIVAGAPKGAPGLNSSGFVVNLLFFGIRACELARPRLCKVLLDLVKLESMLAE